MRNLEIQIDALIAISASTRKETDCSADWSGKAYPATNEFKSASREEY
jgi:hypothetical protein